MTTHSFYYIIYSRISKALLASLMLMIPVAMRGQDSLSHYLARSAQNNPALKASYNQYLASLTMVQQVGSLPDPDLTFGFFVKPKEELMGNQNADIKVMQMFPWLGTQASARREAALMASARFQEFLDARNRLFFDLTAGYYKLYRLEKEIRLAQTNLKYLKTFEKLSLMRFRTAGVTGSAGTIPSATPSQSEGSKGGMSGGMNSSSPTGSSGPATASVGAMSASTAPMPQGKGMVDVLRVQMNIRDLESSLAFLQDQKVPLMADLNRMLNRQPRSPIALPDTLTLMKIDTAFNTLTDSIIAHNPMLKMVTAEKQSYQAKMEKSRLMGLPMVGLGVDYMVLSKRMDASGMADGKDMIMPMVNLTLPIYRKKYNAMRKEAELMMNASEEKHANLVNSLKVDLDNSLLNLKNAERKIRLYIGQSSLASQSLNVLTISYQTAGIDLEEVLRMQQQLLDYQYKLVEAVVEQNTEAANISYLVAKKVVTDDALTSNQPIQ